MRELKRTQGRHVVKGMVLAVMATLGAGSAQAFKVDSSDDWDIRFDNSIQYTMGWRAQSQNEKIANHPVFQSGDAKFPNVGDMVTNRVQDLIELTVVQNRL